MRTLLYLQFFYKSKSVLKQNIYFKESQGNILKYKKFDAILIEIFPVTMFKSQYPLICLARSSVWLETP